MKHLVLILIIALGLYFAWRYADRPTKRVVKKFTGKHALAVITILVLAFCALVAAFYSRSVNIL